MTDWRPTKLGELVGIKHGYAFKGEHFRETPPGDVLLTPGNFAIGGGFQLGKLKYYAGPTVDGFVLSAGDLLVTMTDLSKAGDTLGYPAIVPNDGRRYLHNQRLGKVEVRDARISRDFIYWLMRTRPYREEILSGVTGSTVRHTSPRKIEAFEFALPSRAEQDAICDVLNPLDAKIELNRRVNETLEAMAQAIYRDWFVEFGPVRRKQAGETDPCTIMGGLVTDPSRAVELASLFPARLTDDRSPDGWTLTRVDGVLELVYGRALPRDTRQIGHVPVYGSGGIVGSHSQFLDKGPTLIVGRKGTVGSLYWESGPFFAIDTVFYVKPRRKVPLTYLWQLLQTLGLHEMNTDAAVPGLNRNNVYRLEFSCPPREVLEACDALLSPLRAKIDQGENENRVLADTRDLLLPRLMSGAVMVRSGA